MSQTEMKIEKDALKTQFHELVMEKWMKSKEDRRMPICQCNMFALLFNTFYSIQRHYTQFNRSYIVLHTYPCPMSMSVLGLYLIYIIRCRSYLLHSIASASIRGSFFFVWFWFFSISTQFCCRSSTVIGSILLLIIKASKQIIVFNSVPCSVYSMQVKFYNNIFNLFHSSFSHSRSIEYLR